MSNVSNIKDFRKVVKVNFLGQSVTLDFNKNGQVHEVQPRTVEDTDGTEIPLFDFLHGRTEESATYFLNNYEI